MLITMMVIVILVNFWILIQHTLSADAHEFEFSFCFGYGSCLLKNPLFSVFCSTIIIIITIVITITPSIASIIVTITITSTDPYPTSKWVVVVRNWTAHIWFLTFCEEFSQIWGAR